MYIMCMTQWLFQNKQQSKQKNSKEYFLDPIAMVRDLYEEIRLSIIKTISSLD